MGLGHHHHGPDHGSDAHDEDLLDGAEGIRAVKISLVVLGATALAQLIVLVASGSVALFADSVHNFSDALTAVPLWIAFALGRRAATQRYTYGFGRVEDLAGLFVVVAIALSAVIAAIQAVHRLVDPVRLDHLGWVAAAGFTGFVGNEIVAVYRIRVGRRIGSAALRADGLHARTDGLTSLGVVAGAAGVALGFPLADPVVGLLIAVAIVWVMVLAARDVFGRLLDGVDPAYVATARRVLQAQSRVVDARRVRMRWVGRRLEADVELDVEPTLSLAAAHRLAHDAEHALVHAIPRLATVTVHAYPAHGDGVSS